MDTGIPCIDLSDERNIDGDHLDGGFLQFANEYKKAQKRKEKLKKMRHTLMDSINAQLASRSKIRGGMTGIGTSEAMAEAQKTFDYYNAMGVRNPPKTYYEASRLLRGGGKGGKSSGMSEKNCEKAYAKILKKVIKDFGHSEITNSGELQSYCALRIPNFTSVEPYDRMPKLKQGQSCILNLDDHKGPGSHWVACIRSGRDLIVYDSFGRPTKQILSKLKTGGLRVLDTDPDAEQKESQKSCGQRSIAWLLFCQKHGIENALKL